jgi:hypothetical protein
MKTKILILFTLIAASVCSAQTARIVNSETGEASQPVELTDGARFVMGNTSYRIDIEETKDDQFRKKLKTIRHPLRFDDIGAGIIFGIITQVTDNA